MTAEPAVRYQANRSLYAYASAHAFNAPASAPGGAHLSGPARRRRRGMPTPMPVQPSRPTASDPQFFGGGVTVFSAPKTLVLPLPRLGAHHLGKAVKQVFSADDEVACLWGEGLLGAAKTVACGALGFYTVNGAQFLFGKTVSTAFPWPLLLCSLGAAQSFNVQLTRATEAQNGRPVPLETACDAAHDLAMVAASAAGCWAVVIALFSGTDSVWRLSGHASAPLCGASVSMFACLLLFTAKPIVLFPKQP